MRNIPKPSTIPPMPKVKKPKEERMTLEERKSCIGTKVKKNWYLLHDISRDDYIYIAVDAIVSLDTFRNKIYLADGKAIYLTQNVMKQLFNDIIIGDNTSGCNYKAFLEEDLEK